MPSSFITLEFLIGVGSLLGIVGVLGGAFLRSRHELRFLSHVKAARLEVKKSIITIATATASVSSSSLTMVTDVARGMYAFMPRTKHMLFEALQYVRKAEVLFGRGKMEDAEQHLVQALAVDPENVQAMKALANLYQAQGKCAKAEQALVRIIELGQAESATFECLGDILMSEQRYRAAMEGYKRAIEMEPKRVRLHDQLASAAEYSDDLEQALISFQDVLKLDPKRHQTLLSIARVRIAMGDPDQAEIALAKFLDHRPYDEEAKRMLAEVETMEPSKSTER